MIYILYSGKLDPRLPAHFRSWAGFPGSEYCHIFTGDFPSARKPGFRVAEYYHIYTKNQGQWSELHHSDGSVCALQLGGQWSIFLPLVSLISRSWTLCSRKFNFRLPAYFQSQRSRGETIRAIIVFLSARELRFQVIKYYHTLRVNVIGHNCITAMLTIVQLGGQ